MDPTILWTRLETAENLINTGIGSEQLTLEQVEDLKRRRMNVVSRCRGWEAAEGLLVHLGIRSKIHQIGKCLLLSWRPLVLRDPGNALGLLGC
jgi:hypothetical protein